MITDIPSQSATRAFAKAAAAPPPSPWQRIFILGRLADSLMAQPEAAAALHQARTLPVFDVTAMVRDSKIAVTTGGELYNDETGGQILPVIADFFQGAQESLRRHYPTMRRLDEARGRIHIARSFYDATSTQEESGSTHKISGLRKSNPFLTLQVAAELLRHIHRRHQAMTGGRLTDSVDFDPLQNVENFWHATMKAFPPQKDPHDYSAPAWHQAMHSLTLLSDSIDRFTQKRASSSGWVSLFEMDALGLVRDYTEPYRMEMPKKADTADRAEVVPFLARLKARGLHVPAHTGTGLVPLY